MRECKGRLEKAKEGIQELEDEFEKITQNAAQRNQIWERWKR